MLLLLIQFNPNNILSLSLDDNILIRLGLWILTCLISFIKQSFLENTSFGSKQIQYMSMNNWLMKSNNCHNQCQCSLDECQNVYQLFLTLIIIQN